MKFLSRIFIVTLLISTASTTTWAAEPDPEMSPAATTTQINITKPQSQVENLLSYAKTFRGVPYRYGAMSPKGFDCSGFTSYVYKEFGYKLHRTAGGQLSNGTRVDRNELKPGDLVFFSTYDYGASHVGIYLGDGSFINASSSRGVAVDSLYSGYWGSCYIGARRVI